MQSNYSPCYIINKALGATPVARLGSPIAEEIGTCEKVFVQEIGSQKVVVFEKNTD